MKRIDLGGQPSGRCGLYAGRVRHSGPQPLEILIDHAKELGFELEGLGIVEIFDIGSSPAIYESPVIYLNHSRNFERAVISQRREGNGFVFSLNYYIGRE